MILQFNFVTFSLQFFECLWFHLNAVHTHSSLLMVVQSNLTSLHIRLHLGLDNLTPLYILHDVSYILHPFKSLHIRLHLGLELTGMQYYTYIVHAIFLPLSLMLLYILHIPINLGFDLTQNQFWDKRCKLPWLGPRCVCRPDEQTNRIRVWPNLWMKWWN